MWVHHLSKVGHSGPWNTEKHREEQASQKVLKGILSVLGENKKLGERQVSQYIVKLQCLKGHECVTLSLRWGGAPSFHSANTSAVILLLESFDKQSSSWRVQACMGCGHMSSSWGLQPASHIYKGSPRSQRGSHHWKATATEQQRSLMLLGAPIGWNMKYYTISKNDGGS